ncbi:hypothetical protein [Staphylothermus hellenicus]|uniref:Uncharacterized protein n=1 Tax=Staphylothermus hellenicus (strain DSM 12710 / JCM 10830 / BK20S6-10-b1 / P8) TaxID=591019 RepID=D7D9I1_STAHD|nr:hypothetical protein [Staphylothermus hellenicus]ADI32427.1 hypothetical protein Shell_1335 [Staphylothermus hellenicus DSM 12710]
MNEYIYDYLSSLRDLVNAYEKLIDKLKYVKNASNSDPEKVDRIIPEIKGILEKTTILLSKYEDVIAINSDIDENTQQYLKTYYKYLKLVSIPYTYDLLNELKQVLIKHNYFKKAIKLDTLIKTLSQLT